MAPSRGLLAPDELRTRAEDALRRTRRDVALLSTMEAQRLIHELQVHQVELEMQNEELRAAALELEDTRARYHALYELAPIGYLELDAAGVVRRANIGASILLGIERHSLVGSELAACFRAREAGPVREHLAEAA